MVPTLRWLEVQRKPRPEQSRSARRPEDTATTVRAAGVGRAGGDRDSPSTARRQVHCLRVHACYTLDLAFGHTENLNREEFVDTT